MANVHDVAAYVTDHFDSSISTMKLQKLCFLAQGWSLALRRATLFDDEFQAWANGPVCWNLFDAHRGRYSVDSWSLGDKGKLERDERIVLDAVLKNYEALSGRQLSALTHKPGTPWTITRGGLPETAKSAQVIPNSLIQSYYVGSLTQGTESPSR